MYKLRHSIYLILLIAFDQYTKYLARTELAVRHSVSLLPDILSLHYHENDGAVWGIFSGKVPYLIAFTVIVLGLMLWFYLRLPKTGRFEPLRLIMVFISAGAVGNLLDRILFGYVTDFIYFELINFPIFNVADCYITISAVVLLALTFFYYREEDFDFLSKKRNPGNAEIEEREQEDELEDESEADLGAEPAGKGTVQENRENRKAESEKVRTQAGILTNQAVSAASSCNAADTAFVPKERTIAPEKLAKRKSLLPELSSLERDDDQDDEG